MQEQHEKTLGQQRLQNACQRTQSFSKNKRQTAGSATRHISFLMTIMMTSRSINTARQKMGGNKYFSFHDTEECRCYRSE